MDQEFIPASQDSDMDLLELPEELNQQLRLTQKIRTKIVSKVTKGGTTIPSSEEELKLLMETLKQIDSTTLGEMRIKVDEKSKGIDVLVQETIRQLNRTQAIGHLPPVDAPVERQLPSTPELEEGIELVPDQDHIGLQNLTYDSFKEKFGK